MKMGKMWPMGLLAVVSGMPLGAYAGDLERAWAQAGSFERVLNQAASSDLDGARKEGVGRLPRLPRPPHPVGKDAFAGLNECQVVNARFPRQPSMRDVLQMLKPCLAAVSRRYGVTVSAAESLIPGGGLPGGVPGIGIYVTGLVPPGNNVLVDLQHAVDILRYGSILSYRAKVEYLGEVRPQSSSLQRVVDECTLPMYLAPVRTGPDFVEIYGSCLKGANGFGITLVTVPPSRHVPWTVWVFSHARKDVVESMNGTVNVPGEGGPVRITIWAYPDIQIHPFRQPAQEGPQRR